MLRLRQRTEVQTTHSFDTTTPHPRAKNKLPGLQPSDQMHSRRIPNGIILYNREHQLRQHENVTPLPLCNNICAPKKACDANKQRGNPQSKPHARASITRCLVRGLVKNSSTSLKYHRLISHAHSLFKTDRKALP